MRSNHPVFKVIIALLFIITILLAVVITIFLVKDEKPVAESSVQEAPAVVDTLPVEAAPPVEEKFNLGLDMVLIPSQTFTMGNSDGNPEGTDDELPPHEVTLREFYISRYEITQGQYQRVTGTNPSYFKGENKPVAKINWFDAVNFCNALSRKEGLQECYTFQYGSDGNVSDVSWNRSANGYRLPTEAEYECASQYNTGGQQPEVDRFGWFLVNSGGATHEVGQKEPNKYGLYDMLGNVWEWCWDYYAPYEQGSFTDPVGGSSGSERVTKGGSYTTENRLLRFSDRGHSRTGKSGRDLGMRVVRNRI